MQAILKNSKPKINQTNSKSTPAITKHRYSHKPEFGYLKRVIGKQQNMHGIILSDLQKEVETNEALFQRRHTRNDIGSKETAEGFFYEVS